MSVDLKDINKKIKTFREDGNDFNYRSAKLEILRVIASNIMGLRDDLEEIFNKK